MRQIIKPATASFMHDKRLAIDKRNSDEVDTVTTDEQSIEIGKCSAKAISNEVSSVNKTTCRQRRLSFEQLLLRHSREGLGQSSQPRVQLWP